MSKLTMKEAFTIQAEQLKEWELKLNSKCYKDLLNEVEYRNNSCLNPYDVFRGTEILSFISNWKPTNI